MPTLDAFLSKWTDSEGSEISHSQHFLIDLCDLVGLPRPGTKATDDFRFEKDVDLHAADGKHHGRVDLYRRGAFVLESKQLTKKQRGTKAWELAMQEALGQALAYARGISEPPVFVIACDVGHCFELLACFDGSAHWRPFPDPANNRIFLSELKDPKKLATLSAALREPASLDPSHRQIEITRDIADKIAHLAPALRKAGHTQKAVAAFLMRCLFTMFAEDVGLFEGKKKIFEQYLREFWIKSPASFPSGVSVLWQTMDTGGALMTGEKVHRFNGGLFKDHSALPLTKEQLEILLQAAECDWSEVEPAIFGTLLENALSEKERHSLGAHFTPRAYVERLVRPTIEEPLRAEWLIVRSQVRVLVDKGDEKGALAALKEFHTRLCKIRVLDPACGTGNFLYVAMDLMKQLEAEVLEQIRRIGGVSQELLELDTVTLSPAQFLGIEKNPWAKEIAELVLWIGYLRWQWRLRGTTAIAKSGESILRDEKNIECRDAVLDWDGAPEEKVKLDEKGKPVTRWDGDPRYTIGECFDTFPFPIAADAQKSRIRDLAERLDAHRKRQLAAHEKLTITGMYNVLEKLRSGEELSAKDKVIHEEGLVSILRQLHDELDAAVFDAYGWDPALTDEQILEKLVALNAERAAEEKRGLVRWLRPEFQAPKATKVEPKTEVVQTPLFAEPETVPDSSPPPPIAAPAHAWPAGYFARASAVRDLVAALPEGARFEASDIDAMFKGKNKTRATDVRTILETFAALGQLVTLAPGQFGRASRRAA